MITCHHHINVCILLLVPDICFNSSSSKRHQMTFVSTVLCVEIQELSGWAARDLFFVQLYVTDEQSGT